jgi:hypothetical protein
MIMLNCENSIRLYDDRDCVKELDIDVAYTLERIVDTFKVFVAKMKEDYHINDTVSADLKTLHSFCSDSRSLLSNEEIYDQIAPLMKRVLMDENKEVKLKTLISYRTYLDNFPHDHLCWELRRLIAKRANPLLKEHVDELLENP